MSVSKIACVALLVFFLGACEGGVAEGDAGTGEAAATVAASGESPAAREQASFTPLPASKAQAAAAALVAGDTATAIATTRDVLQRGRVRVLTEQQLLGYAFDARRRAHQHRLDSAELAQMLKGFGFPFRDGLRTSADRDEGIAEAVVEEESSAYREQVAAQMQAAHAEKSAQRQAAEDRMKAEVRALLDPVEARREETAKIRDAIAREQSSAPRDQRAQFAERLAAATRERDQARSDASEARKRAREIEQRFRDERELDEGRIEDRIRGQIGRDRAAGQQLMAFLSDWVREAAKDPDHPDSFTPLFLAEMARRQGRPVDLAAAEPVDPVGHGWSLLELSLFAAAFKPDPAPENEALVTLADVLLPTAHAGEFCDVAKEAWGDWGDVAETGNAEVVGATVDNAFERAFGEHGGKALGKALGAASILGKVLKLASFYSEAQVTVESGHPGVLHKPRYYYTPVVFTARAGVSPEELEAYEEISKRTAGMDKELRACLGWMGLPSSSTIADVAKGAEDWYLDWRLYANGHANWARPDNADAEFLGNGRIGKPMRRVSPSSVESRFVIRVVNERTHTGALGTGQVWVSAEVDSSSLPGLGALVGAGKGPLALADAVVEVASGWIRVVFKPKSQVVLDVEFHCKDPTTIHRYVKDPVADGRGELTDGCTFEFNSRKEFDEWQARHYPE